MSSSISSRRDFLAATAATVALPSTSAGSDPVPVNLPEPCTPRVFQAERELFAIVRLPEFRIVRSGLSRGEAEGWIRSANYYKDLVGDNKRDVMFRQASQVQIDGEPIEVEGLPLDLEEEELSDEDNDELVVMRSDVWIEGAEGREEALVCVEPERAERFAASFNTPGCRCHRAVVTTYEVVRPTNQ